MYHQEHKIAQAEHQLFVAQFNRPATEGVTVQVPNIFDRAFATLRSLLAARRTKRQSYKTAYIHGAPAK